MKTVLFAVCLVCLVGCSSPTAPLSSSTIVPTFSNTNVNISGVALTRAPLRIEFTGNYGWRDASGTYHPPTDPHVLTRPDLPTGAPWGPITTALQLETYLNRSWLPAQFRDQDGARTGFALIHILSFSPTDVNWELRVSDLPVAQWW
jgi:hypothetical protein